MLIFSTRCIHAVIQHLFNVLHEKQFRVIKKTSLNFQFILFSIHPRTIHLFIILHTSHVSMS